MAKKTEAKLPPVPKVPSNQMLMAMRTECMDEVRAVYRKHYFNPMIVTETYSLDGGLAKSETHRIDAQFDAGSYLSAKSKETNGKA